LAGIVQKQKRNVIPRWRSFKETIALGELAPAPRDDSEEPSEDQLLRRQWEWNRNRTIWHAADFVGTAFILQRPHLAREAAEYLLSIAGSPAAAKSLARRLLNQTPSGPAVEIIGATEDFKEIYADIHLARERLQDDPRNAIQWIDLSRQYTILGLDEQAHRAVKVALSLNKSNRFIVRAASRFYVHQGEHDRAHDLVKSATAVRYDPWLLSAEVALAAAAEVPPRFAHLGRRVLQDESINPRSLTELASELGTLELSDGRLRTARKLFRQSLVHANENSLAQAEWAWEQVEGHQLNIKAFNVPYNFEARAWNSYENGLWASALASSRKWLVDQPFSSRPAMLASYVASSILEDYEGGIEILQRSLIPNPDETILLNNIAFAYANLGQIKKAQDALNRAIAGKLGPAEQVCLYATQGLIYYRSREISQGREFYQKALELAATNKFSKLYAEALLYLALEEIRAKSEHAQEAAEIAAKTSEKHLDKSIQILRERLTQRQTEGAEVRNRR
jgi:tetratricopeptide (TPR) repeat protein